MLIPPTGVLVVIPACDEAATISAAVDAVLASAAAATVAVQLIVVADACTDDTAERARAAGALVLDCSENNVGAARAMGFKAGLEATADSESLLLATTDADSRVPRDWLTRLQRYQKIGSDVVVGTVRLSPPEGIGSDPLGESWAVDYERGIGTHHHVHVHGANLAFTASAYVTVGGFRSLATGEDVDLVTRLRAAELNVTTALDIAVETSRRTSGRVPAGFCHTLGSLPV